MSEQWIVQFDSRSDGGPHEVGPFASREAAEHWAASLLGPGWSASFCYVPLAAPQNAGRR